MIRTRIQNYVPKKSDPDPQKIFPDPTHCLEALESRLLGQLADALLTAALAELNAQEVFGVDAARDVQAGGDGERLGRLQVNKGEVALLQDGKTPNLA